MSKQCQQRVIDLGNINAKKKFLSIEPLHGEIDLKEIKVTVLQMEFIVLPVFDWVIVGGESGNNNGPYKYRPCELSWIERIVKDCQNNHIPVFVKQLGTHLAKELKLKDRHGTDIKEFPLHLQIQEFPR
jgi:protein gp37